MRKFAAMLLRAMERFYLYAHGWRSLPTENIHGNYLPPADYPFELKDSYVRTHAVNAQRQVYAKKTKELKGASEQSPIT